MAYTTIDNPELYFQTKLYTGNDTDDHAITLDGNEDMSPNLVWIKSRALTHNHQIHDTVRGVTKHISSDVNNAEATEATGLKSFDSDGFTLGTWDSVNVASSGTYVAWCWKESATAGFDIVSYTGNGSARTISHNLGAVPKMMIIKKRNTAADWSVGHASLGANQVLELNKTGAVFTDASYWNNTRPTSSVFTVGTDGDQNTDGHTYVIYLFAEKQGYSKFGSYVGNGNADGPFVYTGFKPAFVIVKNTGINENWSMHDNKRNDNVIPNYARLTPDDNQAEATNTTFAKVELFSNGFKLGNSADVINDSGVKFIYMAFAEQPFVTSTGVPATAR